MTDSRWLQELTNAYINKSAGVPSNINEELINEQAEYISELEDIVISIAESLEVSVEDLMEYYGSDAVRNTPKGKALALRYAGRVKKLIAGRNEKLVRDSDALGASRGTMAQGDDDAHMGARLHAAAGAAGIETHFSDDPMTPGYIKRKGEEEPITQDTRLNISKRPESFRRIDHRSVEAEGNRARNTRRFNAAKEAAAIEKKRADKAHEDEWSV